MHHINRFCGKRVYRTVNVTILTFGTASLVAAVIKMWLRRADALQLVGSQ